MKLDLEVRHSHVEDHLLHYDFKTSISIQPNLIKRLQVMRYIFKLVNNMLKSAEFWNHIKIGVAI
jgi:hypothetical protein